MALGRDRTDRRSRNGPPRTAGASAEHPVERPGAPGTSGARPGRSGAPLGRADRRLPRSIARALVDGSGNARPMPALAAMLARTASATEAYTVWVASADRPTDRRRLADTVRAADDALSRALAREQDRWGSDPTQWLTFGMTLAMSQRILAEVGRPLGSVERERV